MKRAKLFIIAGLITSMASAHAGLRHYSAELAESKWQISKNTPIECQLTHPIPNYGQALFTTKASRQLNMMFEMDMIRLPDTYGLAEIRSVAPRWRPGVVDHTIAFEKLHKQFDFSADKKVAWSMLNELEKGMSPTLIYNDWYSENDTVTVGLSTGRFREAYAQFVGCLSNLLDYSFDDISYTVLHYESNSDRLTKASRKRLNMIQTYLQHDPDIELLLVEGYSDSYGGRWHNQQMSEKRANSIKQFFAASGVQEDRIAAVGHGEKRHITSNETTLGRAKNRRVVIQMTQP